MSKFLKKLRSLAMSNKRPYHVAAILRRRGVPIKIGANSSKTHPFCRRDYDDGSVAYEMHAETNVLRFALPGDELEVIRFTKTGVSMAKPCIHCQKKIREMKIKRCRYTDHNGEWQELNLKEEK